MGLFVENRYFVVLLVQLGLVGFSIFSRVSRVSKFRAWIRVSISTRASLVFSERERSRLLAVCCCPSVCRLSVICNARAPYPRGSNFLQYFYGIT